MRLFPAMRIFTLLSLILLSRILLAQTDRFDQQPIDTVLAWLDQTYTENPANYYKIALQTLSRAYWTRDDKTIAEAHDRLANWFGFHGLFPGDSTLFHSEKKLEYYLKTGDQKEIAACYRTLTIDYLNSSRYEQAQEAAFKALEIYEKLNDQEGIGKAYRTLSSVFMAQEQAEPSLKYGRKAIEVLEKGGDYYGISLVLINFIRIYNQLGEYGKAVEVADSCIAMVEEKLPDEPFIKARAFSFRGDAYLSMKAYERALDDYIYTWQFVENLVGPEQAATYRTEIGKTLKYLGRYREAIPHLESGIKAYEERNIDLIWEPYELIAICYEQIGNNEKALAHTKKYINAYNKMLEGKIENLESEALIKYETGKKDQALAEQALQIKQQARIQLLSWSIAALLAILFLGLFYFFRRNKKTTAALQTKNEENELLLKEIHHRVKNNLEMVSSLLKLQSVKTKDEEAKGVMEASQNRVQSMGIIHQKLYQGENLASVEMKDYFQNLSDNLLDAFDAHEKVKIKYDMEPVELDVDTAVPIGLIVNELLTNALKYAFPENKKGEIELSLKETADKKLHLRVADNGVGQSVDTEVKGTGFGSQLIRLLTAQLQGSMKASYENGTRLSFWLEKAEMA